MKKIIFLIMATSMLLVGCSDKSDSDSSDKGNTTSVSDEKSDSAVLSEGTENSADDEMDSESSDKTVQNAIDDGNESEGELPVLKGETEKEGEVSESENKPSVTQKDSSSSESENKTSVTKSPSASSETETIVTEDSGVIELPIIKVE